MAAKRVVHISTVHKSDDVRIFLKECSSLAAAGYEVTYLNARVDGPSRMENGVNIRKLDPARGRLARMTRVAAAAGREALREDAAIYHFHDPELVSVGILLKILGKKVVYDIHEDAARDVYDKPYLPEYLKFPASAVVSAVEAIATRFFDGLVCATQGIHDRRRTSHDNAVLVRNLPILDELATPSPAPFRQRASRAVYAGGLAPFNGISQMIEAFGSLPDSSPAKLTLAGQFPRPEDEESARLSPGWARVEFHGWVSRASLGRLLADARCGLVLYQPTPNVMDCEPNKFFEFLSAGLPLVATDLPHWRSFIERHGCGLLVPPDDPDRIAEAIDYLITHPDEAEEMGRRGRSVVECEYNWEKESAALLELYARLVGCP